MSEERPRKRRDWLSELPPDVADFLNGVVQNALMRYDILRFFYLNPYAIVTISDLTTFMSREERPMSEALQQLAKLGYLTQSYASSAYVLTSDRDKRGKLEEFYGYIEEHPEIARKIRGALRSRLEAE